jgi:hypothetical protein
MGLRKYNLHDASYDERKATELWESSATLVKL